MRSICKSKIILVTIIFMVVIGCHSNHSKMINLNYKGYALFFLSNGNFSYFFPTTYQSLFTNDYSLKAQVESNVNPILIGIKISPIKRWKLKSTKNGMPYFFENTIDSLLINTERTPNPIYGGDSIEVYRAYIELEGVSKYYQTEIPLDNDKGILNFLEIFGFHNAGGVKRFDLVQETHFGDKLQRMSVMENDSDYRHFPTLR